jgi:tRNA pseudouridine32 synthase / 23S rRNA pseudouridine746 synthase
VQFESLPLCFTTFEANVQDIALPELFNSPFKYEPHVLSQLAVQQLQQHLATQRDWQHDFDVFGKMMGVLVVQTSDGQLGYLAAFSGKLAESNHLPGFVPPLFDLLNTEGFFKKEEAIITAINHRIEQIEADPDRGARLAEWQQAMIDSASEISACKAKIKTEKIDRDARRTIATQTLSGSALELALTVLNHESAQGFFQLKDLKRHWKIKIDTLESAKNEYELRIEQLKIQRKTMSAALQTKIFEHYGFINQAGVHRSLNDIFGLELPPAGAGECCAPRLLQYAFEQRLKPIAMAEFWWGASPVSAVRKHGNYYPACKKKCEPILGHMLSGMAVMPDTRGDNATIEKSLDMVWEDEHIAVVFKPHGLLSVPGKKVSDAVLTRMQRLYPDATGPLLVHRLDAATSGLLIVAKSMAAYQHLQNQFLERKVKKRYIAILEGILSADEGLIDLPLRVDLDDRPRQMVCTQYGKPSQTRWRVLERFEGRTKVVFWPLTGRTHQLRVHAAHILGLNTPITGDDLYGSKSDRMYLHAEALEFEHPVTGEVMSLERQADF